MDGEECRIDLRGVEISGLQWGKQGGRPVIALHGWLDNAASFGGLVPLLGEKLHVVALDLPGHGRSEGRRGLDAYHFVDWVDVVIEAVDTLGWEEFSILGHSMGAAIASLTAPVVPQRVRRCVFIDGIGPWSERPDAAVQRLRRALAEERSLSMSSPRRYESKEEMVEVLRRTRVGVSAKQLMPLVERAARKDEEGRWFFDVDQKLKAASRLRLTEEHVMTFLNGIECPVLLVRPEKGWPVEEKTIRRRLSAIDDLEVLRIEGGHHVHLEAPQRLASEVGDFLRGGAPS